ncbi:efflux RND transporter periplasmic adaptor subunit [Tichowtungia aerotolerans]|uniref:Efflux RND transporter periplasmic adaptor subunit n=1 Tax=Tichowtungia aerotolerans TaxID=2697043 RepID=A0A6P1M2E8_9BACT|nr:efflux RND transporter periplasmic adaptor subunit [Tichowtungia aerotolerans]QHI68021.1 efflux RND transporter periplasmic adaptor subunit [Tichowtungia aerotolerans]
MMNDRRWLTTGIGILLLIIAMIAAWTFVKTRPKAERKKMSSMVPVVEVCAVESSTRPVRVDALGTVIADAAVSLQAEVSGRVLKVYPDLVEGAFVRKGDVLIEVDPCDYELAVKRAEAALQSAKSSLRLEEGQQAVALHEMELISSVEDVDEAYRDLMLREPQLQAAMAAVSSAEAALDSALVDLERTKIRAPFDAVIQSVSVDVGDQAQTGRSLVELAGAARFYVRVSLPVSNLKYFPNLDTVGYSAEIALSDGSVRSGILYKLQPELTAQGRMAQLLVTVDQPLSGPRPMLIGETVRVDLVGREERDVCLISRRHLRNNSTVWMMDTEGHLHICPAKVIQGYSDQVLVRFEFSRDWKLVTSNIQAPVDGMQLKTVDESAPADENKPEKDANG